MCKFQQTIDVGASVGLLLGQRHRRWSNSKPTLARHLMAAGMLVSPILPWSVSRECLTHEPGRIEHYKQLYLSMWSSWGEGCLRFKPHWMFQIYKKVIKGHEELSSCSSLMHRYLFPLLDVLYRQVGNFSFWTVRCTEFRHGGQYSYGGRHQ